MKSYVIHLIRHGLTVANKEGRYAGQTDYPLCPEGETELLALKEQYDYPPADAYFVSPLTRCRQTLNILYDTPPAIEVPDLRECNFGDWEDKPAKELSADPIFIEWMEKGGMVTPPNGENSEDFSKRVCGAFETIVEGMMRSKIFETVIVAHGGTLMAILAAYGLPKASMQEWLCANGCGYSIRINMSMWLNSRLFEVYDKIPQGVDPRMSDEQLKMFQPSAEFSDDNQ